MSQSVFPLAGGQWLGMLGGGQLGRMFVHAAQAMGYRVAVLDPAADSPAGAAADRQIVAAYDDAVGLDALAAQCAAVSTEFENVPAASLQRLAAAGVRVGPAGEAVAITQDRIAEKAFVASQGVPVAPHVAVRSVADLSAAPDALFPGILKLASLGYDGKGQAVVADREQAVAAFREFGGAACVLEARLELAYEVSIVVARDFEGRHVAYPVSRNIHRNGILAVSAAPAPGLPAALAEEVERIGLTLVAGLDYRGVLCIEFFVLRDGSLVVNEMAPRPHNSGHYTIDACLCSQFEQQARVLAGLPLGATRALAPSVMLNILGDAWFATGEQREPDWAGMLAVPGSRLHLYGKREPRVGRKMGHITCVGVSMTQALAGARAVGGILGVPVPADADWQ
ncbi:5-(carboxyamino)imidazole ribonucleotide synthase [Verticiella sediminum]|uniref:N5-carboxyaminoimidazole ribonucleotide synthase n=1 Tax=Verticiella sediminum TaxID=1247510 RepID=A0A556AVU9_9BURK|nr:5-(carboxyamino)imidazole ribonucleotide synthase [Verticiella sediminum]TSH97079.1 5-(carboxyamino)imidazole ribonucleotide synthase [Verticiella sediminum]